MDLPRHVADLRRGERVSPFQSAVVPVHSEMDGAWSDTLQREMKAFLRSRANADKSTPYVVPYNLECFTFSLPFVYRNSIFGWVKSPNSNSTPYVVAYNVCGQVSDCRDMSPLSRCWRGSRFSLSGLTSAATASNISRASKAASPRRDKCTPYVVPYKVSIKPS